MHPNVRYTVDAYLKGEPVEAVELRPGLAIATLGIPVEYGLNYCYDCTANRRCSLHQPSRAPSPAPSSGTLGRLPTSASLFVDGRTPSPRASARDGSSRPYTPRGGNSKSPRAEISTDRTSQHQQSAYAKREEGRPPASLYASERQAYSSNNRNNRARSPDYERVGYSLKNGTYSDVSGPKKRSL